MPTQDEIIQSILMTLSKIPPLNVMRKDVNLLQSICVPMVGATAITNGKTGLVPAPSVNERDKFLRGDGTWQTVATKSGDSVSIETVDPEDPLIDKNIVFTDSDSTSSKNKIYKTNVFRFSGDSNDTRMMYLSIGKPGVTKYINSGLELTRGLYKFKLTPPLNVSKDMFYKLPRFINKVDIELASVEYINSEYYSKIDCDEKYLNKNNPDTVVELSVWGTGSNNTGGLKLIQPNGSNGKSVVMRNDGNIFHILNSPNIDGTMDETEGTTTDPLSINLSTGICDINGTATYAKYDRLGNLIDGVYVKNGSESKFTKMSLSNASNGATATLTNDSSGNIQVDKLMRTTTNITNNNGYWYRNIAAGTSASPVTSGVCHGSIYLQYT